MGRGKTASQLTRKFCTFHSKSVSTKTKLAGDMRTLRWCRLRGPKLAHQHTEKRLLFTSRSLLPAETSPRCGMLRRCGMLNVASFASEKFHRSCKKSRKSCSLHTSSYQLLAINIYIYIFSKTMSKPTPTTIERVGEATTFHGAESALQIDNPTLELFLRNRPVRMSESFRVCFC